MNTADEPQARPGAPVTHVLYLHGFRSSPRSFKAQRMAAWMQAHRPDVHWWCPQLPPSPREAVDLLLQGTADWPKDGMAVVGSSLGGFYATVLAERRSCRAVLINPAVEPARDLARYIGEQTAFHDPQQHFFFRAEFVDELRELHPPAITNPRRYLAFVATGDEVLDWHEMAARYAQCGLHVIEGSDHALSDFDAHLPRLLGFLGLQPSAV
ncbi:YqiA/YcfP family alpha/beta fold hydrolase [Azohydromonas lata]|uniref:YqiA/YcfP family alpha/beta fold hydrolase n=1 Tax=Azohydromonas lata TaxID=45677 RepID=A0ABU5IQN0_9BURK|nr:YqiA/YcfP family alpha/beta fold hydrolase [Azohydromonas lata]MDZ5461177.1 YqiA/YcfP family alpha/beta fold hydrolase [Azohydromonas lata]